MQGARVPDAPPPMRERRLVGLALIVTVAAGLASRRFGASLPGFIAEYGGDALWATSAFLLLALIAPRERTRNLALSAFAIAVVVELSQLSDARWLDAIRSTTIGALALGHGFLLSDLLCYAVGIVVAVALDVAMLRPRHAPRVTAT